MAGKNDWQAILTGQLVIFSVNLDMTLILNIALLKRRAWTYASRRFRQQFLVTFSRGHVFIQVNGFSRGR